MDEALTFLKIIVWPGTLIFLLLHFKNELLTLINSRDVHIDTKFGKVLLPKIEANIDINNFQRKEVLGLSGHDIWALRSIGDTNIAKGSNIDLMDNASKVMAKYFIEKGLAVRDGHTIRRTELANQVLEAADNIFED